MTLRLITEPELEARLIEMMQRSEFAQTCASYERMLKQLGNVDGNEVIALALIAKEMPEYGM